MEDTFRVKEGDRNDQAKKLSKLLAELEGKLLKIDEMYLRGEFEADSYKRLKGKATEDLNQCRREIEALMAMDTNFMKYCRYGMTLLTHLDDYYAEGSLEIKRKLIGSVFPEKLVFEKGSYRTSQVNPAIELIGQFSKELGNKKAGSFFPTEKMSGYVPRIGLEPTHLSAPEPKSGVSTNFTTWAKVEKTC
jgi:site-specific DNA recombinase